VTFTFTCLGCSNSQHESCSLKAELAPGVCCCAGKYRPPTTKQIDDACREGFIVLYGDRRVTGAVLHRTNEVTIKGRVWINLEDDYSWHYVPAGDVVITAKVGRRRRKVMPTGKRAPGSPSHLKLAAKKGAQSPPKKDASSETAKEKLKTGKIETVDEEMTGQKLLPGAERKAHTAIEKQALVVERAKTAKTRATRKFNEETDILTKMMLEADIPQQDLPDGREAFIDREPVAKVRDKKEPKSTRTQAHEEIDDEEDES
jgi:hypothetical protein